MIFPCSLQSYLGVMDRHAKPSPARIYRRCPSGLLRMSSEQLSGSTDRVGDVDNTTMQRTSAGWGNGLLGVIIFSGSLPATRVAVGGFTPLFLTSARAVIAALIGVAVLGLLRQARPQR